MEIEAIVLRSLTTNEEYTRKVVPFLTKEYFKEQSQRAIYLIADQYFRKYNKCASIDVLNIEVEKLQGVKEELYTEIKKDIEYLGSLNVEGALDWLIDETELFCQDRALYNAIQKTIEITRGDEKRLSKTAIPQIMQDALAVRFDDKLGHDYIDDAEHQHQHYSNPESKIPFDIEKLNEITGGGIPRKTLNLIIAATHGGKSLIMGYLANSYYLMGYNVLYISMEMSEEQLRQRSDANLLNVDMDDVPYMKEENYLARVRSIAERTRGRMKYKEYPTAGASVSNFRHYVNELKIKQNFVPDVIIVDYLNICASDRFKSADNSYAYHKAISEELRGFAHETNTILWTATQLNRTGFQDSDPGMGEVSDSFGVAFTADFTFVTYRNEELIRMNQIMFKQEKNRYKDLNYCKKFILGIETARMRIYDLEESAQASMPHIDDVPPPVSNKANKFQGFK